MEKNGKLQNGATTQLNVKQKCGFRSMRISFGRSWLPLLYSIFLSLSIIIPYCIAVKLGHVKPIFPSISDDGTNPPESCIFGQLLNLAAFFGFATMLTRYKQINEYQDVPENVLKWNNTAFVLGSQAILGMSLVANFQETNIHIVHVTGASMCFTQGTVYEFIQSWISYKLTPQHCSLRTSRLRLAISILTAIFFFSYLLFDQLAEHTERIPADWRFVFHVVSNMSEWVTAFCSTFFFLTFVREFQKTEVKRCQKLLHKACDSLIYECTALNELP